MSWGFQGQRQKAFVCNSAAGLRGRLIHTDRPLGGTPGLRSGHPTPGPGHRRDEASKGSQTFDVGVTSTKAPDLVGLREAVPNGALSALLTAESVSVSKSCGFMALSWGWRGTQQEYGAHACLHLSRLPAPHPTLLKT